MSDVKIESIDKNLAVTTTIEAEGLRLYDVRNEPFQIYGLYNPREEPEFKRMPDDVAKSVNKGVSSLYLHTAGGRVRFSTDSPYIVIKAVMPKITHFSHMPLTGSSGFDLYIDTPDGAQSLWHKTFVPPYHMTDGYESKVDVNATGLLHYTINFPLYNPLTALYIGIKEGSCLGAGAPYRDFDPIVYYGSSITQGGCASRPGNAYQAMVTRALNIDHINLGFSGSGLAEDSIVDYMKKLPMSAFVSDYDHNAPNAEHLEKTHYKMYEAIRKENPDIPYIMLSRPDFHFHNTFIGGAEQSIRRRKVILDTFHRAREDGDKNVYFIDGESLYRGAYEDCCSVDGSHPNDLGFSKFAEAIECVLRRILRNGMMKPRS
jgi:lysophospholipase L1-like esterase